jgi:hypothetical protein
MKCEVRKDGTHPGRAGTEVPRTTLFNELDADSDCRDTRRLSVTDPDHRIELPL